MRIYMYAYFNVKKLFGEKNIDWWNHRFAAQIHPTNCSATSPNWALRFCDKIWHDVFCWDWTKHFGSDEFERKLAVNRPFTHQSTKFRCRTTSFFFVACYIQCSLNESLTIYLHCVCWKCHCERVQIIDENSRFKNSIMYVYIFDQFSCKHSHCYLDSTNEQFKLWIYS